VTRATGRPVGLLTVAALVLALTACAAPPVRYYSLAGGLPDPVGPGAVVAGTTNGAPLHIEVAPVGVPERLARPQMVVRIARGNEQELPSSQVAVLEEQRWASSLDSELRDAFAGAIASRAGAVDVTRGGRLPGQPVYRIAIRASQLLASLDRQVDAVFGWTITRTDDSRHAICEVSVSRPADKGMDALVQAIKQVVAVAADHIATDIAQLQARGTADCESGANARRLPASERTTGLLPKAADAPSGQSAPASLSQPTRTGTAKGPAKGTAPRRVKDTTKNGAVKRVTKGATNATSKRPTRTTKAAVTTPSTGSGGTAPPR
jgi:uncharacterized lipoprotein YmbA